MTAWTPLCTPESMDYQSDFTWNVSKIVHIIGTIPRTVDAGKARQAQGERKMEIKYIKVPTLWVFKHLVSLFRIWQFWQWLFSNFSLQYFSWQLQVQRCENKLWNMFKVNNKDTRTTSLTGLFTVNFEHISHLVFTPLNTVLVSLLFLLNTQMPDEYML